MYIVLRPLGESGSATMRSWYTSVTSMKWVVSPQATRSLWPTMTKGAPAMLAPMTLTPGLRSSILVERGRGRELQVRVVGENGQPGARSLPEITNWLLPRSSSGPFSAACKNGKGATCDRYSAAQIHQHRVAGRHAWLTSVTPALPSDVAAADDCSRRAARGTSACVRDRRCIVEWRKTMDVLEEQ